MSIPSIWGFMHKRLNKNVNNDQTHTHVGWGDVVKSLRENIKKKCFFLGVTNASFTVRINLRVNISRFIKCMCANIEWTIHFLMSLWCSLFFIIFVYSGFSFMSVAKFVSSKWMLIWEKLDAQLDNDFLKVFRNKLPAKIIKDRNENSCDIIQIVKH